MDLKQKNDVKLQLAAVITNLELVSDLIDDEDLASAKVLFIKNLSLLRRIGLRLIWEKIGMDNKA